MSLKAEWMFQGPLKYSHCSPLVMDLFLKFPQLSSLPLLVLSSHETQIMFLLDSGWKTATTPSKISLYVRWDFICLCSNSRTSKNSIYCGWYYSLCDDDQIEKLNEKAETEEVIEDENEESNPDRLEDLLSVELVELEVGYGLVNLVDSSQNGDLLERITQIRKQFAVDWGIIIPSVKIKDNLELKPGGYSIKLKALKSPMGNL